MRSTVPDLRILALPTFGLALGVSVATTYGPVLLRELGLKTFIVLFVVEGLGQSIGVATAVIAVAAASYVGAPLWSGRLADRVPEREAEPEPAFA